MFIRLLVYISEAQGSCSLFRCDSISSKYHQITIHMLICQITINFLSSILNQIHFYNIMLMVVWLSKSKTPINSDLEKSDLLGCDKVNWLWSDVRRPSDLAILPVSCQEDAESDREKKKLWPLYLHDSLLQYMISAHTFWSHHLCINCFIYSVEYLVFEECYLCLVALGCGN